jgi:hypothetical protein
MSSWVWRFLPFVAALAVLACARPVQLEGADTAAQSTQVVIVSAAGKIATSTPAGAGTRIPPTPTFEQGFGSILTPLAGSPTEVPGTPGMSPTPEIRPTRTPAPTFTAFPTLEVPPTAERIGQVFQAPPTRTPSPPTPARAGQPAPTRAPTRAATATPADPNGDIADLANAKAVSVGADVPGLLNGPKAVNSFSFDVGPDDEQIVATLTGQDIEHYRLYLISPGRQASAYGQPLGASGRVIRFPTRGESGTWFVQVAGDGKKAPTGNYSLKVETRGGSATGG